MTIDFAEDPPEPNRKEAVAIAVNEIAGALRTLIEIARSAVERITPADANMIGLYLNSQIERANEELARIAANDPGAFARFAFDMPITTPETRREARQFVPSSQQALRPRVPLDAPVSVPTTPPPAAEIPLGRLSRAAGGGVVRGAPPPPPPMQTGPVDGVTYLEDLKETNNG